MNQIIDNIIAYKILSMLVKPFTDTDAYKLGIIDDKGNNLIKTKDLTTQEQKNAYNYLVKLVFNLKKILNKLPGGESKLKNVVAAFFLVKESYINRQKVDSQAVEHLISLLDSGVILAEEQLIVEEFFSIVLLNEDAPANATGAGVSTDGPVVRRPARRFARFVVNDEVYNKFSNGKTKFRKWAQYLNLEDEGQQEIYKFAKKHPNGVIILHNGKETKAIRFNRKGGGAWSKIKRPTKQISNEII
jgi:hypothetical protein